MVFKSSCSKHGIQIKWFKTWYSNQVVQNMVFKSSVAKHGIQVKLFKTWYSNQVVQNMVFKSSGAKHGIQVKLFTSWSGVMVFLSRMELAFKFAFKSQLQVWCHMVIKTADVLSNSKRGLGLDIIGCRANSDWTVYTHFLT
ncbi:hypothetical protein E3N88_04047 [Mikania micrantha]|uniref:Uncharacterized protein n=1 Tax=Mikania micrantha TaxID=192012 RepID=A0A5N6PTA3_9ASTR|nr:hypothetical protein E3N88_04047 [Mikania micrantha]